MANLIVYYSRKGQNYWNGSIVDLAKGNTERVAEFIQKAVGGDLFEIETVREYSKDYMTCTEEAKEELREHARPELKRYLDNIEQYDTIFVGYPNWSTGDKSDSVPSLSLGWRRYVFVGTSERL